GGAFDGIGLKIASRLHTNIIGYSVDKKISAVDKDNLLQYISPPDLKSFGLIPEIVGRLPVVTYLNPLDKETLKQILVKPKNAIIKQFVKLFEMDNITLTFDEKVYDYIVDKSIEYKLGARGLRSILEAIMTNAMFEFPSDKSVKKINVTKSYAEKQLNKTNISRLKVA
ncbi:MAG: ATP-dependent Clp protease ATP-binding subunit ClpX, partial [Bacteroidales bacterium]|nr:ATP-dependent Clp protease ATP-binding subunit ClpX [Bacteroidales bacterium]